MKDANTMVDSQTKKVVGISFEKKDAMDKVLGKAMYAADIKFDNMLVVGVKRSDIPCGKIISINIEKAKKLPGVAAVLTHKDIPGQNGVGIITKEEPVLIIDKIRRQGDAIVVVAAENKKILEEALDLIEVEILETKGVYTIQDALKEDSPKVHGDTNVLAKRFLTRGDVDAAFKKCDIIIENDYHTPQIQHSFIEPEATLAKYEGGTLTLWSSTQNSHFDRDEVARVLALPQNRVRSIQAITGGGFGGKLDISTQCLAALAAYYTKRPVKMVQDRRNSMIVSSKRHEQFMKFKTGATKEGKVIAMEAELLLDTGAYGSYGLAVITRSVVHATGPYYIPNVRVNATMVYTNNPMAGAMRGFGVPQVAVAHESQMDILAEKLGFDPIEFRMMNCLKVGSVTATGQKLVDSVGIYETLEKAAAKASEVLD
jgi:CO/xanthine dehydrogenase Mo-binding subunit